MLKLNTIFQMISKKHANLITQSLTTSTSTLILTARNAEAVVRSAVTPFDNKEPRIESSSGFSRTIALSADDDN